MIDRIYKIFTVSVQVPIVFAEESNTWASGIAHYNFESEQEEAKFKADKLWKHKFSYTALVNKTSNRRAARVDHSLL